MSGLVRIDQLSLKRSGHILPHLFRRLVHVLIRIFDCAFVSDTVDVEANRAQALDDGFVTDRLRGVIGQGDRSEDEGSDFAQGDLFADVFSWVRPKSALVGFTLDAAPSTTR